MKVSHTLITWKNIMYMGNMYASFRGIHIESQPQSNCSNLDFLWLSTVSQGRRQDKTLNRHGCFLIHNSWQFLCHST